MTFCRNLSLLGSLSLSFLLLAVASGCVQLQTPLADREDGFIDSYLLGRWNSVVVNDQGIFDSGSLAVEIKPADNGDLEITVIGEEWAATADFVMTGYSTRLDGKVYLNARVVECLGCSDEDQAEIRSDSCPYHIYQYATSMPRKLAVAAEERNPKIKADALIAQAKALDGQLLFYAVMDVKYVSDAIDSQEVAGDSYCKTCFTGEDACISSKQEAHQGFVLQHDAEIYPLDNWSWLIRAPKQ